jgi:hypothetical protein
VGSNYTSPIKYINMKNKDYNAIIEYFKKVNSTVKTAKKFGYSNSGIHQILKRNGLKGLDKSETQRKHTFNQEYFENIDTEGKAYWLGFLYADGYIGKNNNEVTLALSSKDRKHIEKFSNSIDSTYTIRDKFVKSGKFIGKNYSVLSVFSSKTKSDLIDKGCFNCKSLILKFPTKVPDELVHHFIRGYFDGDGSVFISKEKHHRSGKIENIIHCRILGTYDFISEMNKFLGFDSIVVKKYKNSDKKNMYEFVIKRKVRCEKLMNYLYKNANVYLERKKQIFDNYF